MIVARQASQVHAGRDTSRYAEGTRALLAFGASVSDEQYQDALDRRSRLSAAIDASLGGVDVLAGPTVGYTAPEQDPPFGVGDDAGEGRFTGPYNLTGHPAISLPVPAPAFRPACSWPPAAARTASCSGSPPQPSACSPDRLRRQSDRPRHRYHQVSRGRPVIAPAYRHPGYREGELTMSSQLTRSTLRLAGLDVPVVELTGAQDGPLLTVIAGVHGCEYVPMAAVRQWTAGLASRELRGRVRAVPVLNLPAFAARSPFVVPDDGKNLNRCFPGSPDGTLAERLAYDTFTQLITGSDALVDAHCGDLVEALEPFALYEAGPAEAKARELATAYGLGYVIRQEPGPDRAVAGTTSSAAAEIGIPAITAEAGGCGLVQRHPVGQHVGGLNRVLAQLGMTDEPDGEPARHRPATSAGSSGCAAPTPAGGSQRWRPARR